MEGKCCFEVPLTKTISVPCERDATHIVREYRTPQAAKLTGEAFHDMPGCSECARVFVRSTRTLRDGRKQFDVIAFDAMW